MFNIMRYHERSRDIMTFKCFFMAIGQHLNVCSAVRFSPERTWVGTSANAMSSALRFRNCERWDGVGWGNLVIEMWFNGSLLVLNGDWMLIFLFLSEIYIMGFHDVGHILELWKDIAPLLESSWYRFCMFFFLFSWEIQGEKQNAWGPAYVDRAVVGFVGWLVMPRFTGKYTKKGILSGKLT